MSAPKDSLPNDTQPKDTHADTLIDHLYEIAVEPDRFDRFVEAWADGMSELEDDTLGRHLDRAKVFLARLEPDEPDHAAILKRYDRFAAFIVSDRNMVESANSGAESAFGLTAGDRLDAARLSDTASHKLGAMLAEARASGDTRQIFLRLDRADKKGAVLLRLQRLAQSGAVLFVSTHFRWNPASDRILAEAYDLTEAERHVVRLLVEGQDTSSIAALRRTTEGTTRGQIKSIIFKMNLRSQADIVRVTLMMGEMPGIDQDAPAKPALQKNWVEQEVWKPFSSVYLPDGRRQSYHAMGPADGAPILLTHLGSCMVRWTAPMLRLAFAHGLRVICPIRAGYGQSELPKAPYDPFELTTQDSLALLRHLGIKALPYVVQGSDFPLAAHFTSRHSAHVTELISLGGRPCLPDGSQAEGQGTWQRFFVSVASKAPKMTEFAASAVMAMSRRIGPGAMLRSLCKDSAADMALLELPQVAAVLEANITLMSAKSSEAARAFAREYIAFQSDWSALVPSDGTVPTRIVIADQDPTFDLKHLPRLAAAYPQLRFEVRENAGLALLYQHYTDLIPMLATAAHAAR